MTNYRGMYTELLLAQTEAIDQLESITLLLQTATDSLKAAQRAAEETYIGGESPALELLD